MISVVERFPTVVEKVVDPFATLIIIDVLVTPVNCPSVEKFIPMLVNSSDEVFSANSILDIISSVTLPDCFSVGVSYSLVLHVQVSPSLTQITSSPAQISLSSLQMVLSFDEHPDKTLLEQP
jgi:hypothetical protein